MQFEGALKTNTWTAFNVVKGATKAMMSNKLGGSIVLASASSKLALRIVLCMLLTLSFTHITAYKDVVTPGT